MTETLDEKVKNWKRYGSLAALLNIVISVSEIENTNRADWTLKTERLISILKQERSRIERIERINSKTDK